MLPLISNLWWSYSYRFRHDQDIRAEFENFIRATVSVRLDQELHDRAKEVALPLAMCEACIHSAIFPPGHLENWAARISKFELRITNFELRISNFESSSLIEIRHSNDPNTPRGVHLYLIDFIDITTYDIQLKILFIYSKYQIVHRKSTWICSFDLERTVGVLLFHWNTGAIDIVIWLFQPTFKINQWRT